MSGTLKAERTVAGIRCRDVLADLSLYLDGELADARRAQLEAHVSGCDACTRMGGEVGALVAALRDKLGVEETPADVAARLDDLLRRL